MPRLTCPNEVAAREYEDLRAEDVWDAYVDAGCFLAGRWRFASFDPDDPDDFAEVKIDGERLYGHGQAFGTVLSAVAYHPCVQAADVLTFRARRSEKVYECASVCAE
jgi:hypothetical protein